jgi:hypothetical protein
MIAPLLFHTLEYPVTLAWLHEVRHVLSEHPSQLLLGPAQHVIVAATSQTARPALLEHVARQGLVRHRAYLPHINTATKHHPFTPVNVIPWIKYLCKKMNRISTGMIVTVAAAMSTFVWVKN